jgi:hypothetical protein
MHEGLQKGGLGVEHEWSVLAGSRDDLPGRPTRVRAGRACLVDEGLRTDGHVGLRAFAQVAEMDHVFALDGVPGCADVDPVAGRRGDALIPGLIEATVPHDDA